jgi:hypothetical protein
MTFQLVAFRRFFLHMCNLYTILLEYQGLYTLSLISGYNIKARNRQCMQSTKKDSERGSYTKRMV